VILGSDRIVYGISPTQKNKLIPFFNAEDQMVINKTFRGYQHSI